MELETLSTTSPCVSKVIFIFQANLKHFMEHVRKGDIEKLNKISNKGLDPNFHEHETGGKENKKKQNGVIS